MAVPRMSRVRRITRAATPARASAAQSSRAAQPKAARGRAGRAPAGQSRTGRRPGSESPGGRPLSNRASPRRFGFVHLVDAIAAYAKSARCANDLDRMVVLERMRQEFDSEPATLLGRGFDKAYRQVMEGV